MIGVEFKQTTQKIVSLKNFGALESEVRTSVASLAPSFEYNYFGGLKNGSSITQELDGIIHSLWIFTSSSQLTDADFE